jgi:hypothetical protein
MLSVIMPSFIMLNVIMLSVVQLCSSSECLNDCFFKFQFICKFDGSLSNISCFDFFSFFYPRR